MMQVLNEIWEMLTAILAFVYIIGSGVFFYWLSIRIVKMFVSLGGTKR